MSSCSEHGTAKYLLLIFGGLCCPERGRGSLFGPWILFAEMSQRGVQQGSALLYHCQGGLREESA
jgi:hypothetical protein